MLGMEGSRGVSRTTGGAHGLQRLEATLKFLESSTSNRVDGLDGVREALAVNGSFPPRKLPHLPGCAVSSLLPQLPCQHYSPLLYQSPPAWHPQFFSGRHDIRVWRRSWTSEAATSCSGKCVRDRPKLARVAQVASISPRDCHSSCS